MPWCPVCKNEYVKGRARCPDCDAVLTDELPKDAREEKESVPLLTKEEVSARDARADMTQRRGVYQSARERRADVRSSAWTFLIIGGIGFAVVTLALVGFITLPFHLFALAVMEAMFLVFLAVAFVSFRNALKMLDDISREDCLESRIRKWAKESLSLQELLAETEEDAPEEMKYFILSESIRQRLTLAFPEVEDSYAEEMAEALYNEFFPPVRL